MSPSPAAEMARYPLHIEVEVPGAAFPRALWTVHRKSGTTGIANEFRRAIEARRLAEDVQAWTASHSPLAPWSCSATSTTTMRRARHWR